MENTSKSNLLMQFDILKEGIDHQMSAIESSDDIQDIDCDGMIECFEGIKQIKVALKTLTN